MRVEIYPCGPYETNVYILRNPVTREAVVIDAAPDSFSKLKDVFKDHKVHLFLTHGHWDHTTDATAFQQAGATIYAHKGDISFYTRPEQMRMLTPLEIPLKPVRPNHWVEDRQKVSLAGTVLEIIHIPGHTLGQIGIYIENHNCLFVGDTLFLEGVGRTDLPGGDFSHLEKSIRQKIYTLPENTFVYPGHGLSSTVEHEKRSNPFVSC